MINILFSILIYYAKGIVIGYIKYSMEIKYIDLFFLFLLNVELHSLKV